MGSMGGGDSSMGTEDKGHGEWSMFNDVNGKFHFTNTYNNVLCLIFTDLHL